MKRLKKIFVEITNRCNLACSFCAIGSCPTADMAPEAFADLLPQLKPFTSYLSLHVMGEPLLHPDLGELLDHCHSHGFQVNLTTNGTLLPHHGELLLASPALRQVDISLHSVSGQDSTFNTEDYLAGVLDFARQAAAQGIYVSLRIWDLPEVPELPDEGVKRWQEEVLSRLEAFFALTEPLTDTVTKGQGCKLAEGIFLSQKELFAWPTMAGPDLGEKGTCLGLRDQAAILVDGTVVPCCLDAEGQIPLGNILRESFGEIIGGERAGRMRSGFEQRKVVEPLCRRCSYRQRF